MKEIITRKNEIRRTTSNPKEMINMYLAERVLKGWKEDFVDEDTGDVTTIERNEVLFEKGVLVTQDLLTELNFHIQCGDVKEVTVSNQMRMGICMPNDYLSPWQVTTKDHENKKKRFILYSSSSEMATEIVKDYYELNHSGLFYVSQIKELDSIVILKDTLKKRVVEEVVPIEDFEVAQDEEIENPKFYQLDVIITIYGSATRTFIVETTDIDKAILIIKNNIIKNSDAPDIANILQIKLEAAKQVPCNTIIDYEFCKAYANE